MIDIEVHWEHTEHMPNVHRKTATCYVVTDVGW